MPCPNCGSREIETRAIADCLHFDCGSVYSLHSGTRYILGHDCRLLSMEQRIEKLESKMRDVLPDLR